MPKLFEAPALTRYGQVEELTAIDVKCTPGADGGLTFWESSNSGELTYTPFGNPEAKTTATGSAISAADLFSGQFCRDATQGDGGERSMWGDGTDA